MTDQRKENFINLYSIYKNYGNISASKLYMQEQDGKIFFNPLDDEEKALGLDRVKNTEGDYITTCKKHNDKEVIRAFNFYKKIKPLVEKEGRKSLLYNKYTFLEDIIDYFLTWYLEEDLEFPIDWKGINTISDLTQDSNEHNEVKELNNILRIMTNKLKDKNSEIATLKSGMQFKLGKTTDSDLEEMADSCRFKNGKLNYTKLGKRLGVSKDTIRKEIIRRRLTHLLKPTD